MEICNSEELKNIGIVKFYDCGSLKLCKFLVQEKRIVPIKSFVSKKTGRLIYRFVKSKELDKALTEWHDNKNKRQVIEPDESK